MKHWGDVVSGAGAVVLSLLSCAVCPMCLPLYAGFLSIIGIEVGEIHEFFFPIMMGFSLLTLGLMAYQIHSHHSEWGPFKLASGSALGMVLSAFYDYDYLLYACLALFMGSIFWNKRSISHSPAHTGHGCC